MERQNKALRNRLLLLVMALFMALTLAVVFRPSAAEAKTVKLKGVTMKQWYMRPSHTKAKSLRKGDNTVIFTSHVFETKVKWHFAKFTSKKTKKYTFTFTNMVSPGDDTVFGGITPYTVWHGSNHNVTIKTPYGKVSELYICSPNAFDPTEPLNQYSNAPCVYMTLKLRKGQTIYFSFNAASDDPNVYVNVNIK